MDPRLPDEVIETAARPDSDMLQLLGHEFREPLVAIEDCVRILRMPLSQSEQEQTDRVWQILELQLAPLGHRLEDVFGVTGGPARPAPEVPFDLPLGFSSVGPAKASAPSSEPRPTQDEP